MKYILPGFLFLFSSIGALAQDTLRTFLLYDSGKHELTKSHIQTIDSLIKIISTREITVLEVNGHTDIEGNTKFNLTLSEKRMNSVIQYFLTQPIKPVLIKTNYFGDLVPISTNKTFNRRTEIIIVLKKQEVPTVCDPKKIIGHQYNLDLDEDGIDDFTIYYDEAPMMMGRGGKNSGSLDKPRPIYAYIRDARPYANTWMNQSYILINNVSGLAGIKDLLPGQMIRSIRYDEKGVLHSRQTVTIPELRLDYAWCEESPGNTIISFNRETNQWEYSGKLKTNIRYVGFMIITADGNYKIGYLKLEFDSCTGIIRILEKKITSDQSILITE